MTAAVGIGGAVRQFTLPSLPEDTLVVAVARFTPVSHGASEEADNISHRIEEELRREMAEGLAIEIRHLSIAVSYGLDEQTRHDEAKQRGKRYAHLIVWGDVRKDEGEFFVEAYLTVARRWRQTSIQDGQLGWLKSEHPTRLRLKQYLCTEIGDIVMFLCGLTYYETGNWNRAAEILDRVQSDEGRLYKGLCLYERARASADPCRDLRAAIGAFEEIPWDSSATAGGLTWMAYVNRAAAAVALGLSSAPGDSGSYLSEAVEAYRSLLHVTTRANVPEEWALIQNNLGAALLGLATRTSGKGAIPLLRAAVDTCRVALQVQTEADHPYSWAATQTNLGSALRNLGTELGGPEGACVLIEAAEAHVAALRVLTYSSQDWAVAQDNLGVALCSLGVALWSLGAQVGGETGLRMLEKATGAYQNALQVRSRNDFPQLWARTQRNLGAALYQLGVQTPGQKGTEFLQAAVETCTVVLEVLTPHNSPLEWARTHVNLGLQRRALGNAVRAEDGIAHLRAAEDAFRTALQVHTEQALPLDWARIHVHLGATLMDLAMRLGSRHGERYVEEAIASFDNALTVYNHEDYPLRHSEVQSWKAAAMELRRRVAQP